MNIRILVAAAAVLSAFPAQSMASGAVSATYGYVAALENAACMRDVGMYLGIDEWSEENELCHADSLDLLKRQIRVFEMGSITHTSESYSDNGSVTVIVTGMDVDTGNPVEQQFSWRMHDGRWVLNSHAIDLRFPPSPS